MKLLCRTLLFTLSFYFINTARSQLVTVDVEQQPLEKVFVLVEQQSGYSFIYSAEMMAISKPVSVRANKEKLSVVLEACFKNQPLTYTISEKHIVVKLKQLATLSALKGKIVNENSEPIPGVSVQVKENNALTVSDNDGNFSFADVPAGALLIVSGAEIETVEISAGGQSRLVIHVKRKVGILDETMVIAYGKTSRRYATGTVSSIKANEIASQPAPNILSVLAGRVTGLQVSQTSGAPGTYIRVLLRGQNSIANGKDPLIIVDGIPFPSQPLNGALGGGAGVSSSPLNSLSPSDIASIEVLKDADATAIYGSRGANGVILVTTKKAVQGETRVTLRMLEGIGKITRKMKLMNTPEYLAMRKEAYANDGLTPGISDAPDLLLWDTTRYTDWQKELIGRTAHMTDGNISVSGGSLQTQFLLGAAWHRQTSVFPGDFGEDRKSVNLSVTHSSVDQRFRIAISASYSNYKSVLPKNDFFSEITLAPDAPRIYSQQGALNWENGTWVNPLAKKYATFESQTGNLNSSLDVTYKLMRRLHFRFNGGFSQMSARDLVQTPQLSFNPSWGIASSAGFGSKNVQTVIGEPQLEYGTVLGKGNVSVLGGITLQESRQRGLYQTATGYATDDLLQSIRSAGQVSIINELDVRYRYAGLFARVKYDYENKYLLSLTARRDGSSRYGEQSRFANFWSTGAAWIFTNEGFIRKGSALSFGKLKVSAGITGNDQIGDYKYLRLYTPGSYSYLGVIPFYPAQHYNPKYSWEKVRKLEAGLDLGLFADRLLATVNYYFNTTSNQLVNSPLPVMTGFNGILRNIPAVIRNSGWEVELNAKVYTSKKITWSTSFNISVPRNKLVSFDNLANSSYASQYMIGQPLTIERKLNYTGVDPVTGVYTFRDYNNDGSISFSSDQQQIINTGQQFYGGWQNSVSLGKFSASILFQFIRQRSGINYLFFFAQPGVAYNEPAFLVNRWRKPGENAPYQRASFAAADAGTAFFNYSYSDAAYSNASFIRLRNLTISYDLKSKRKKALDCLFFIEGQNLLTITRYKGLDPENLSQAVPPISMIVAGFQLTL